MLSKSILTSKTFWLNVVAIGLTAANLLPVKYGVPALGVLNILNRFLTTGSVSITGS